MYLNGVNDSYKNNFIKKIQKVGDVTIADLYPLQNFFYISIKNFINTSI